MSLKVDGWRAAFGDGKEVRVRNALTSNEILFDTLRVLVPSRCIFTVLVEVLLNSRREEMLFQSKQDTSQLQV
jgi:hypothetical protein